MVLTHLPLPVARPVATPVTRPRTVTMALVLLAVPVPLNRPHRQAAGAVAQVALILPMAMAAGHLGPLAAGQVQARLAVTLASRISASKAVRITVPTLPMVTLMEPAIAMARYGRVAKPLPEAQPMVRRKTLSFSPR